MNLSQNIKSNTSVKYHFSIPDSYAVAMLNMILLRAMQEHNEWFYDDFVIDSCYGCPQGCIWNGNREFPGQSYGREIIAEIVNTYRSFNITYRATFTNFLLEEEHLRDAYGNLIAEVLSEYNGEVIVSIPLMFDYIKTKYPQLGITWSTTTDFGGTNSERVAKINELSHSRVVVVPFDMNNNVVLKELTNPHNIEVLVNEDCIDNCPRRREHETLCNLFNMGKISTTEDCLMGEYRGTEKWQMHSFISRMGLEKYVQRGIDRFKISGRQNVLQTLWGYFAYFVKKSHWTDFNDFANSFKRRALGTQDNGQPFVADDIVRNTIFFTENEAKIAEANDKLW